MPDPSRGDLDSLCGMAVRPKVQQGLSVITDTSSLRRAERQLEANTRLIALAGRLGRIGGWSIDLRSQRLQWSDMVAEIHGLPKGNQPKMEEAIAFYVPEHRERIRQLFEACAQHGVAYDAELQIINTQGQPVWVRTTGEPVYDDAHHIIGVHGALQDMSAQKAAELEAKATSERLRATLESITDAFYILNRDWRFTYLNREAARLLRRAPTALLGEVIWSCFPEFKGSPLEDNLRDAMVIQSSVNFELYARTLRSWFDIRVYPNAEGLSVYFQDVTERHLMIRQLQTQKGELRRSRDQLIELVETRKALIDSLPANIALLDASATIIDINDQWRRFGEQNGFEGERFGLGTNYLELCDRTEGDRNQEAAPVSAGLRAVLNGDQESFALEYPCHSPDERRWFRVAITRLQREGSTAAEARADGAVVMHVDITERKLAELELHRASRHDRMTGLLTRRSFVEAIDERLRSSTMQGAVLAMLDVRDLRSINDSHGFEAGDRVLCEIARWLEQRAAADGLVARIAGDQFSILLAADAGLSAARRISALKTLKLNAPVTEDDSELEMLIDIGYTCVEETTTSAEALMHQAELALFQQQRLYSEPQPIAYNLALDQRVHQRLEITRDLRIGLAEQQFELHYQPKVRLTDGALVSAEALIRWNHPRRGLLPPGAFIPIAEQSQLIARIGRWAIEQACKQLRDWREAGLDLVSVAVNVSMIQFRSKRFIDEVRGALERFEIAPGSLALEITESVFESASDGLLATLNALRADGLKLSLDDFGTGYSSLAYLQRYPFDEIKVDRAFVSRVLEDRYSRTILASVKGIADALGATLVAEGIETEAIRAALLDLGYEYGQGYLFSMPLETEDFRWLLTERDQRPSDSIQGRGHEETQNRSAKPEGQRRATSTAEVPGPTRSLDPS